MFVKVITCKEKLTDGHTEIKCSHDFNTFNRVYISIISRCQKQPLVEENDYTLLQNVAVV